jgi:hypothetical protein
MCYDVQSIKKLSDETKCDNEMNDSSICYNIKENEIQLKNCSEPKLLARLKLLPYKLKDLDKLGNQILKKVMNKFVNFLCLKIILKSIIIVA